MLGRVRASPSSLESLDDSPSKILKDDSLSVYEATLMKLKLGARRDNQSASPKEVDDSSASSSCVEEAKAVLNRNQASNSGSQHVKTTPPCDETMMMETDCSCISTFPSSSGHVSFDGNSQQRRRSDVSILHFFKLKDPVSGNSSVSSCGEVASSKGGGTVTVSSSSAESRCTSEMESVQSLVDCELS